MRRHPCPGCVNVLRPAVAHTGSGSSPSAPRRRLVLAVPLGAVLPALHEPGGHLVHVLPLLCRRVRDDAVVEAHADLALVRQPDAKRPLHREQRVTDARDRALQGVLVATYVPHQRRVVRRHLRGRLHVPDVLQLEVVNAEPAEVAERLQRDPERPRLHLRTQGGRELMDRVLCAHDLAERRAVTLVEQYGHAPALAIPLDIEPHI